MQITYLRFLAACRGKGWVWKDGRSIAILIMGYFSFRMAVGYLFVPPLRTVSGALTALEEFLPIWFYGAAWLICALLCVLFAFRKHDTVPIVAFSMLNSLWFISYAWDFGESVFLHVEVNRAWFNSLLYLGLLLIAIILVPRLKNPYAIEVSRGTDGDG